MNEVVYAIWNFAWGENWFLYELGEADDDFYCRCVDADSWETLALGLGDSPTEAHTLIGGDPKKARDYAGNVEEQGFRGEPQARAGQKRGLAARQ